MTDHILLGGDERSRTRVHGFAPWTPRASTEQLLAQVDLILTEYVDHLPLILRQIFYRLVGAHGYEKTELAYDRLCEHLNRARCARHPKSQHPHTKPIGLNSRLIGAVTKPDDLVVDPAAGGFIVLRAAMALGRKFIGCDIAHHKEDQTAA